MKILINLSVLKEGGGLQVAHSVMEELKKLPGQHSYCILTSLNVAIHINSSSFPGNFSFHLIDPSPSNFKKGRTSRTQLKGIETFFKPDIVFTLFGPSYWRPNAIHICGYALPHFIYPQSPFFKLISKKEKLKWKALGFLKFLSFKRDADYFITETKDASQRLAKKLNIVESKVFTVNNTYNGVFDVPEKWIDSKSIFVPVKGFKLITITAYYTHKNLQIIPAVIDYLCSAHPAFEFTFILTIDQEKMTKLTDQQAKHIMFLGKVSVEECPELYRNSDALFMPTLLECFTASYLEAMKMEKPILTSNLPFANDICQDAASYFDPLKANDIGEKIIALAQNIELQKALIKKGIARLKTFGTANDRVQSYLAIMEKIVQENKINNGN